MEQEQTTAAVPAAPVTGAPQGPRNFGPPGGGPGARPGSGPFRGGPRFSRGRGRFGAPRPRKVCRFCADKQLSIDYKDIRLIINFTTERGKILPGRQTGACASHQRRLREAITRARMMAMLPFAVKD
ncbi:MAG: 30S ribosomal protein S18 [Elusimicrobiota bacterium]|mgnify:CR=1 FL=1